MWWPKGIARDLLASTEGKLWWRRLFTDPDNGPLVGCDSRRRRFEGVLAHLITIREMPGWQVEVIDDGLGARPHTVRTTTRTGHTYLSSAGPAP